MRRRAIVIAAMLASCTAANPPQPDPQEPATSPAPALAPPELETRRLQLDLGEALGGRIAPIQPAPGRYASKLRFSLHRFITMEHTISEGVEGTAIVHLLADGSVSACFAGRTSSASERSKYATESGEHERRASDHEWRQGMSGRWVEVEQGVELHIDRVDYRDCEVDPGSEPRPEPLVLRCFGLPAGPKLPHPALLCAVPEQQTIAELALLLGDSPRAGSWHLRHDPGRQSASVPEHAEPFLLLGGAPGLELERDDDERSPTPLTLGAAEVPDPR